MKIYDVIKELKKDKSKLFMVKNYGYWGTDYECQIPSPIITMNSSKIVFYSSGETVRLSFAILNCEFEEVKGFNKYISLK